MTRDIKPIVDFHTHSLASGHAYSTLKENCEAAAAAGLTFLGTTEHGEKLPGAQNNIYFRNFKVFRRKMYGVIVLRGAEANIMDYEGNLDIGEDDNKELDYMIVSLHPPCIQPGTKEENTRAYIQAMDRSKVKIIGHPDDGRYPIDKEALVKAAKEKGIFIEINNSSLNRKNRRVNGEENIRELLRLCQKYRLPVALGTDAHIEWDVGNFTRTLKLLKEEEFPPELVLNFSEPEELLRRTGLEYILEEIHGE